MTLGISYPKQSYTGDVKELFRRRGEITQVTAWNLVAIRKAIQTSVAAAAAV